MQYTLATTEAASAHSLMLTNKPMICDFSVYFMAVVMMPWDGTGNTYPTAESTEMLL